jgi:hypothetical protein
MEDIQVRNEERSIANVNAFGNSITAASQTTQQLPLPTKFQRRARNELLSAEKSTSACNPAASSSFISSSFVSVPNYSPYEYRRRYNKAIGLEIEDEMSRIERATGQDIQLMHHLVFGGSDDLMVVDTKSGHIG